MHHVRVLSQRDCRGTLETKCWKCFATFSKEGTCWLVCNSVWPNRFVLDFSGFGARPS